MTITTEALTFAFLADSALFVIISLFFFGYCLKTIYRVHDMIESVIELIDLVEAHYRREETE